MIDLSLSRSYAGIVPPIYVFRRIMILTLLVLSLIGAFFSGLLGVGGAVILIPLLSAVPPLVGVGELSMHEVSGLTMLQVLAASVTGWMSHRKGGYAHMPTMLSIGIPMGIFSFGGAVVSGYMPDLFLRFLFACLVLTAFVMLIQGKQAADEEDMSFEFKQIPSMLSGAGVGFVAGVIGAGGGFVMIPVMLKVLKLPMRIAVGSSLGVLFIGALMGSIGKIVGNQVEWQYLFPVIAGSLPGSLIGAKVSKKLPQKRIKQILLILVTLIMIKSWYSLLVGVLGGS